MKEMTCTVDVLPEDCIKVRMENDDWGVLFDKDTQEDAIVVSSGKVAKSGRDVARVLVPLYPLDSSTLCAIAEASEKARDEGRLSFSLVVCEKEARVGFIAI